MHESSIPLLLNMKTTNTVWFIWSRERDLLETIPQPTIPFVLHRNIDIPDMTDTNLTHPQIVKPETGLDEISMTISVFNLQRHAKSPKPPL